jgi:hypothetical protein
MYFITTHFLSVSSPKLIPDSLGKTLQGVTRQIKDGALIELQ